MKRENFWDYVEECHVSPYEIGDQYYNSYTYKNWNLIIFSETRNYLISDEESSTGASLTEEEYRTVITINWNVYCYDINTYDGFAEFVIWFIEWMAHWISVDELLNRR